MWESEDKLREFIYKDNNYDRLLKGEIGINLIQTHSAMSLGVMDDWVEYVFRAAEEILGDQFQSDPEKAEILASIRAFCWGRVHNIWGADRNESNPCVPLHYDVAAWIHSPLTTPISEHKLAHPVVYRFGFPEAKKQEMDAQIKRYGTTATGIGRIVVQMGRDRIWREPEALSTELVSS